MNIDFCNSKAFKIDSDELKEKIMLECDLLFGFKLKRGYFPGSQPVAIEKKDFEKLKTEEYMVCEKTDGERAILLLININNKPMCFIINRNNDYFFLDFSFKKEVFEGTVMDGEIIKNKFGDWNYIIHDCMIYNSISFMGKNHRLRYACIIDFIIKRYVNKKTDCLNIKTKLFYTYGIGIEKTWKLIKETTENKIDGLIFTPVNGTVNFGRDYSILKWKDLENHTVDLLVKIENKKVHYYYLKNNENFLFKSFVSSSLNFKKISDFIKKNKITMEEPIIEFKITPNDCFTPYRVRNDKKFLDFFL
jgi:hypothetical protein